jgi:uncharacterized membrane protein
MDRFKAILYLKKLHLDGGKIRAWDVVFFVIFMPFSVILASKKMHLVGTIQIKDSLVIPTEVMKFIIAHSVYKNITNSLFINIENWKGYSPMV